MILVNSNLGKIQPQSPASAEDLQEMARRAWIERGVLTVQVDSVANDFDRLFLKQFADDLYGKRG